MPDVGEYTVKLPDVGEGIAEAEIVEWHVGVGDTIEEDDVIAEVMTDKATVELPSPVGGVVSWLGGAVGDIISVGAALVKLDTGAEHTVAAAPPPDSGVVADDPAPGPSPGPSPGLSPVIDAVRPSKATPTAAPAVRARAAQLGIDLNSVSGSGPDGRVGHGDLDAFITEGLAPRPTSISEADAVESVKITGLRRNIAQRMQASKRRIPHFTYVEEVDVTELEALRAALNDDRCEAQPKLSILPFLMRALIAAVAQHPQMNSLFDDEAGVLHRHRAVHLGVAVQTARGLMVPVVKHAADRDVWGCAEEVIRLSEAARTGRIKLDELTGSTITITSLGALGGIVSTPVINAPEVAIIGVNKIVERAVFVDRIVVPRKIMNLSSSFDHRVVDGADAAAFVQTIRLLMETPALLFMQA